MNTASSDLTQPCQARDFAEWHRGCPWCAVWLLWLDLPPVQGRVISVRAALQPWLLPQYARQPHVTLAYRGLQSAGAAHPAAEFGVKQLSRDLEALEALKLQPWHIRLQGAGSFSTVPYLGVEDDGALAAVHAALAPVPLWADWQYVPHVTLGHYGTAVPMSEVQTCLDRAVQDQAPMTVRVEHIWLARYRTHDIAGPLTLEGCWDLRQQRYVPQQGALLRP